jgi:hypothetical protein
MSRRSRVAQQPLGDARDRGLPVGHRRLLGGQHDDRQATTVAPQQRGLVGDAGAPAALKGLSKKPVPGLVSSVRG